MKYFLTALLIGLMVSNLAGQDSFLGNYKWKNRLILLFAEGTNSPVLDAQLNELIQDETGINERDIKIFVVQSSSVTDPQGQVYYDAQPEVLRRNFRIHNGDFRIILIGKDGGPKMMQRRFVNNSEIFDLIDSMPMRQQEMRDRKN